MGKDACPIRTLLPLSKILGLNGKVISRLDAIITVVISIIDLAGGIVVTTCVLEVTKRIEQPLETLLES